MLCDKVTSETLKPSVTIQKTLCDLTAFRMSISPTSADRPLAHSSPTSNECQTTNYIGTAPRRIRNDSTHRSGKFWLYFNRIKNDVTENEMYSMVAESLGNTDAIIVKKLVSSWTDVSRLPYVSFKVGVDDSLRERALCSSTWPRGICFREFKEQCYTWEPQIRIARIV